MQQSGQRCILQDCVSVRFCFQVCPRVKDSHLDCKATFAAADRLLVRLPLVRPAGLRDVDVFLPAEALP